MCRGDQSYEHILEEHCEVNCFLIFFLFVHKNHVWGKNLHEYVKGTLLHLCWHYSIFTLFHHFSLEHFYRCVCFQHLPFWLYIHWPRISENGASGCLCSNVHHICPLLIVVYLWAETFVYSTQGAYEVILNFMHQTLICDDRFWRCNQLCHLYCYLSYLYHMSNCHLACFILETAGNDTEGITTWPLWFQIWCVFKCMSPCQSFGASDNPVSFKASLALWELSSKNAGIHVYYCFSVQLPVVVVGQCAYFHWSALVC